MTCEFIKVHPLPTKQDLEKIQQAVKKILSQSPQQGTKKLRLEPAGNRTSLEDFSKELIYRRIPLRKLLCLFQGQLNQEYREAFLLHVFLMVHRITFDQQYMMEGNKTDDADKITSTYNKEIEQLFTEHNLAINQSEINALFAYIKG